MPIFATAHGLAHVKLWHLSPEDTSSKCIATLEGHTRGVECVQFHKNGNLLATASDDKTVKLWRLSDDLSSASCIATLEGHTDCVTDVKFHPTGPFLATSSSDRTLKIWRLLKDNSSAICIDTLKGHTSYNHSVAFDSTGKILASGSSDSTVKLWDCYKLSTEYRRQIALTHGSLATSLIGKITESPAVLTHQSYMRSLLQQSIGNVLKINTQASRTNADTIKAEKYLELEHHQVQPIIDVDKSEDIAKSHGGGRSRKKYKNKISRKNSL
jgi:WD40 repeat protein